MTVRDNEVKAVARPAVWFRMLFHLVHDGGDLSVIYRFDEVSFSSDTNSPIVINISNVIVDLERYVISLFVSWRPEYSKE